MDRGAWCRLLSTGSQRVGHDWVASLHFGFGACSVCPFFPYLGGTGLSTYSQETASPHPHPAVATNCCWLGCRSECADGGRRERWRCISDSGKKLVGGVKCPGNSIQGFQNRDQQTGKQRANLLPAWLLGRKSLYQGHIAVCLLFSSSLETEKANFRKRLLLQEISNLVSRPKWFGQALAKYLISFNGLVGKTSSCFEVFLVLHETYLYLTPQALPNGNSVDLINPDLMSWGQFSVASSWKVCWDSGPYRTFLQLMLEKTQIEKGTYSQ